VGVHVREKIEFELGGGMGNHEPICIRAAQHIIRNLQFVVDILDVGAPLASESQSSTWRLGRSAETLHVHFPVFP